MHSPLFLSAVVACALTSTALAQLSQVSQFGTGGAAVSCAYSAFTDTVWVYGSFGATIRQFSSAGTLLATIPWPGGTANDADLEVAPVPLVLASTPVPPGSLLCINGESGVAEIYAIDPLSGSVIASLTTSFGVSHVVGGAYHPQRGTFFLVQDRVPSGAADKNLVAEVSAANGQVLGTFQTTATNPLFTVNFGDLDVAASGNLMIVSSDESEIGEFTTGGAWIDGHALPAGVGGLSGLGIDETSCRLWIISSAGLVTELAAGPPGSITNLGGGCGTAVHTVVGSPVPGGSVSAIVSNLNPSYFPFIVSDLTDPGVGVPGILFGCSCNLFFTSSYVLWLQSSLLLQIPQNASVCGVEIWLQGGELDLIFGTGACAIVPTVVHAEFANAYKVLIQ